jgi:hypothetical protein
MVDTCDSQYGLPAITDAHLAMLQAQDLLDVVDLGIAINLGDACITHVQQLTPVSSRGGIIMKSAV